MVKFAKWLPIALAVAAGIAFAQFPPALKVMKHR